MNRKIFIILILPVLLIPGLVRSQPDPNFHIYLMFGQSNMEGAGTIEAQDRVINPRVKVLQDLDCSNLNRTYGNWYPAAPPLNRCWSGLGPGDSFGKMMADHLPDSISIGLVNVSVSGCNIFIYKKGCPNGLDQISQGIPFDCGYTWLLDLAQKAQQAGVIKGILFHQGETNNTDQTWKYTVQQIVSDLKADLGIGDVPFLAGELLYSEYGSCCSAHNVEINKLPGLIPECAVISAKGLPGVDYAHFTSASYRTLGQRYAQKMLQMVYGICDSTLITPSLKVGVSEMVAGDSVLVQSGTRLLLSPQPSNLLGSWQWMGAGTSGVLREALANTSIQGNFTAQVTYTNECGSKSRLSYQVVVCDTTPIETWYQVNGGDWIQAANVNVYRGSELILGPKPDDTVGIWSWIGAGTSGHERLQTIPTTSLKSSLAQISYTNQCGAVSHSTMAVRVCDSVKIDSWIKAGDQFTVKTDSIAVLQGTYLRISPTANSTNGTWNWSGAGLSGGDREQIVNTDTAGIYTAVVSYTNLCGFVAERPILITVEKSASSGFHESGIGDIRIFPNPSADGFFRVVSNQPVFRIEIFNLLGRRIATYGKLNQSEIQVSTTSEKGFYFLRIYNIHGVSMQRVEVQ